MAYAEIYWLDFGDELSNTWRVGIEKDGYVGSSTKIKGQDNPMDIKWDNNDIMAPIRTSTCVLNLISETNFYYVDFFTAIATDYVCVVKKNGTTFWTGLLIPENYTEPYIDIPYHITLKFSCGLAYLKQIQFAESTANTLNTDSIHGIIFNAIAVLPLPVRKNVREIFNIRENQMTVAMVGSIKWIMLNTHAYIKYNLDRNINEGISYYDMLYKIMESFKCTIMQWENLFYVWRIDESFRANPDYFEWASNGTLLDSGNLTLNKIITNKDVGNPDELIWIERSPEMGITEKLDAIITKYIYDLDKRNNFYLLPGGGSIYTNPGDGANRNRSYLWDESATLSAVTAGLYHYFPTSNNYAKILLANSLLSLNKNLNSNYSLHGLQNTAATKTYAGLYLSTNDTMKLTIETLLKIHVNATYANNYYTNNEDTTGFFHFKIKIGSYYLSRANNGDLSWSLTDQIVSLPKVWKNPLVLNMVFPDADIIYNKASNQVIIELPSIPVSDYYDVDFWMYLPSVTQKGNPDAVTSRQFTEMGWYLYVLADGEIKGLLQQYVNEINSTQKKELIINLPHSDAIHLADINGIKIYNVSDPSDPLLPADWYHISFPAVFYPHPEVFIINPLTKLYSEFRNQIRGTLFGDIDIWNMLTETGKSYDRGLRFHIVSMGFNPKKNQYDVLLEEMNGSVIGTITQVPSGTEGEIIQGNANPSLPFGTFTATITNLGGMGSYTNVSVTNPTKIRIDYINNNTETGMRDAVSYP